MVTRAPLHVLIAQLRSDNGPDYALQLCDAIEALRAALRDAQEWAAGYPLGGGTDAIAARQVYEHISGVLAALDIPA